MNKKKNIPIRHHYIPQFILRNFEVDNNGSINCYDIHDHSYSSVTAREIFVTKNLYKDRINSPDDPMEIEKNFSIFEREVSEIIFTSFLEGRDIIISESNCEKIIFFMALMSFRSKRVRDHFAKSLPPDSKEMYSAFQNDQNFEDLWKRNLKHLVTCRNINDVYHESAIDTVFKLFMRRDVFGLFGKHISVVNTKGPVKFVLGDANPTIVSGESTSEIILESYDICPISPNRAILIVNKGAESAPRDVTHLRPLIFLPPSKDNDAKIKIHVKTLFDEEVICLNRSICEASEDKILFTSNHSDEIMTYLLK